MKNIFKKLAGLLDPAVALLSLFAGAFFKAVRMYGLHRLPLTRSLLKRLGVMPITSHYYDPMFSEKDQRSPLDQPRALPGLDLNESGQAAFLASLLDGQEFCEVALAPGSGFVFPNGTFETGDAEFWYAVVRTVKPRRIIEIGCGQSTRIAVMAIARNKKEDPSYDCEMTCIEPYEMPWLEQLGIRVIRERVELLDRSIFSGLQAGDILFIDSSHMIRPQGDVLHEFLEILPSLPSGVYVHVHDIFTPRDYPAAWLLDHMRFWNEQYLLEAFLTENTRWEIVAGVNYLKHAQFDALRRVCPMMEANREPGSFYMRKK